MNRKRLIAAGLTAVLSMTVFAGCGGGNNSSTAGGDSAPAADSTPADSQTAEADGQTGSTGGGKEVVIWDYFETDAQKEMMQKLIDGFNASQSEYTASHVYVPFSDYEK